MHTLLLPLYNNSLTKPELKCFSHMFPNIKNYLIIIVGKVKYWSACKISFHVNLIGGVMVSMPALNAVDHVFKPRPGQTQNFKIDICCCTVKQTTFGRKQRVVGSESG